MQKHKNTRHSLFGLGDVISHIGVTLLAISIAFSLPTLAQFILYKWWPMVTANSNWLLATEISVATLLVLFFNAAKSSMENRAFVGCAKLASLVHARSNASWLSRWRERLLFRKMPVTRDICVLTVTGHDTFINKDSHFKQVLQSVCEIRVMLVNPMSVGAQTHFDALSDTKEDPAQLFVEIDASIAYLSELRRLGKKVTLKLYDHKPFWKLIIMGEHVWVQYCHSGDAINNLPEYVFALHPENPKRGLFTPFYMHFLEKWGEPVHPDFDFETGELVYRDVTGNETKRVLLQPLPNAGGKEQAPFHLQAQA